MFFLFLVSVSIPVPFSMRRGGGRRSERQGDRGGVGAPQGGVRRWILGKRHLGDGLSWNGGHLWLWTDRNADPIRRQKSVRQGLGPLTTTERTNENLVNRQNPIQGASMEAHLQICENQ